MSARKASSIQEELDAAGPRPEAEATRKEKKNYAERLSRALAMRVAGGLRKSFPGISPDEAGGHQESPARSARGRKKLDVNYSTPELGLGLGVSIKTINYRDRSTGRYTKNYSRVDNELRAEAMDYHVRQPFSVMAALIFIPADSCLDGKGHHPSSFGAAVRSFRYRAARRDPKNEEQLFEEVFIGLYEAEGEDRGEVRFFDVAEKPPKQGRPSDDNLLTFSQVLARIERTYDARNNPPFEWA